MEIRKGVSTTATIAICYLHFLGEFLLCARLRPSDIDADSFRVIRRGHPGASRLGVLSGRADGLMGTESTDYVLGRKNDRRQAKIQKELKQAERKHRKTGRAAPLFKEFDDQTCETAELSAFEVPPWHSRDGECGYRTKVGGAAGRCAKQFSQCRRLVYRVDWVVDDSPSRL
jgi:hypothetical protein